MKKGDIYENCNCSSDCKSTILSVFDTKQQIDLNEYCSYASPILQYASYIMNNHKLWFYVSSLKEHNKMPSPLTFTNVCKYLVQHRLVVVKVEMATKSMMSSVRDRRFSFEAQIASLGSPYLIDYLPFVLLYRFTSFFQAEHLVCLSE